jgi:hypothetical protein
MMTDKLDFNFVIDINTQELMLRMVEAFVDNKCPEGVDIETALDGFENAMPKISEGMTRATVAAAEYFVQQLTTALNKAGFTKEQVHQWTDARLN